MRTKLAAFFHLFALVCLHSPYLYVLKPVAQGDAARSLLLQHEYMYLFCITKRSCHYTEGSGTHISNQSSKEKTAAERCFPCNYVSTFTVFPPLSLSLFLIPYHILCTSQLNLTNHFELNDFAVVLPETNNKICTGQNWLFLASC